MTKDERVDKLKRELSLTAVIAFVTLLIVICFAEIESTSKEMLLVLLGTLIGVVKDIYGFYFGSSIGSERKTELLNEPLQPITQFSAREATMKEVNNVE